MDTIEIIERWLYGRKKTTQQAYLRDVQAALEWWDNPALDELTLPDMQDYQEFLYHERGLRPSSVNRKMSALASLFEFAIGQRWLPSNPCKGLKRPQVGNSVHQRILSREQVKTLIASASTERNRAMLLFAYATGARISEVCSVRWRDVQSKASGAVVRFVGKRDKERFVRIPDSVCDALGCIQGDSKPEDRIFPMTRANAHSIMKAAVFVAGIPEDASFHWLRHSNASHAIEAGAPLPVVRDSLGHSSIAVTDIYAHSNPEQSSSDFLEF